MDEWIKKVRRQNPVGTCWKPSKHSRICSEHFIGSSKSSNPLHPGYAPSVFPTEHVKIANEEHFQRHQKLKAARSKSFVTTKRNKGTRIQMSCDDSADLVIDKVVHLPIGIQTINSRISGSLSVFCDVPSVNEKKHPSKYPWWSVVICYIYKEQIYLYNDEIYETFTHWDTSFRRNFREAGKLQGKHRDSMKCLLVHMLPSWKYAVKVKTNFVRVNEYSLSV